MRISITDKQKKLLVAAFFLFLTLAGLWMGKDYGVPMDEKVEQSFFMDNIYEYACRLLGEDNALVRRARHHDAVPISSNPDRDHGEAMFYLLTPAFLIKDERVYTQVWHAYIWLITMLGAVALYFLMRSLGASRLVSCASVLLLLLSPRIFAQGHYNNKDSVLLSLVLCIFSMAAQLMRKRKYKYVLLFALSGAFAANDKILGVCIWGAAGLCVLWAWRREGKLKGKDIAMMLTAILSFCAFYVLLTPAMWVEPIAFFAYLIDSSTHFSRINPSVLFEGAYYRPADGVPLPWYYLPKLIGLTVPPVFLLLALFGQIAAIIRCVKGDRNTQILLAVTVGCLAPLVYAMVSKPVLYSGWRHFYFVHAGIAVMGGVALMWLEKRVQGKRLLKGLALTLLGGVFLVQAGSLCVNHPYQYAYYNLFAGEVTDRYELDYWAVSNYNAMKLLAASTQRSNALPLICGGQAEDPLRNNLAALSDRERKGLSYTMEEDAPYLILNTSYITNEALNAITGYHRLFSISAYGNELAVVLERDG